jgi:hypothetical protein
LDAQTIFDNYILESGALCINISYPNRTKVKAFFEKPNDTESKTVFDESHKEIFHLMARDSFMRFCRTTEYLEYWAKNVESYDQVTNPVKATAI